MRQMALRFLLCPVWTLCSVVATSALGAQTPKPPNAIQSEQPMARDASPAFLVATIKPSDPASTRGGFPTEGHRIACYGETVETILSVAYGVHKKQIVGSPEWLSKERFDIEGIPDTPGVPSLQQMQTMYQRLLAERFHLVVRREIREIPVYAITVAKGGPKLKAADPTGVLNTGNATNGGQRRLRFTHMPMSAFALNLNFYENRPVIDQTGLTGTYDFTLEWTYGTSQEGAADAPPSLFTAVREQLGLNINAVKAPADVLVISRVEQPSAN